MPSSFPFEPTLRKTFFFTADAIWIGFWYCIFNFITVREVLRRIWPDLFDILPGKRTSSTTTSPPSPTTTSRSPSCGWPASWSVTPTWSLWPCPPSSRQRSRWTPSSNRRSNRSTRRLNRPRCPRMTKISRWHRKFRGRKILRDGGKIQIDLFLQNILIRCCWRETKEKKK